MPGKSIRLFLVDGTPQGIRTAEVGNWTGLAVMCPRTELARFARRPEARKTGIYILVGPPDAASSRVRIYVGEGDEVWTRLSSHDSTKDFWTHVVVFVSKDENLTKAHVRFLEAALVREIKQAKRAEVTNGTEPVGGKLPEADVADMVTYLENVRLLLPTLGVDVFAVEQSMSSPASGELRLELKWEDSKAECAVRDGQFVVLANSLARAKEGESLGDAMRALRRDLQKAGALVPVPNSPGALRFTGDYAFTSPSAAAAAVMGTSVNGREAWKVRESGITYNEWEARSVSAASDDADGR